MSGGCRALSLEGFLYCYKHQEIMASKGFYNFVCRRVSLRLVSDMLDSNLQWKSRFSLSKGLIGYIDSMSGKA